MADIARIEERLDRVAAGAVAVSNEVGGIQFQTMLEVMEFAKLMSLSQAAVPSHLRGNPGACLAISIQALEWKMSPFAVANKSYLVNNKGEERIAYESQLLHAIIEARAPLQGRLRFEILGEGDDRRCKVYGIFKGETEPHIYISETLGKLREARGRNDYGKLKGSPLWDTQPEVQLFYSASRQWGRLFCPDTILGIYTPEELDHVGPDNAKDVNARPSVADRLKGNKGRGFNASHVERETHGVIEETGGASQQTNSREQVSPVAETVTTPIDAAQVDPAGEKPAPNSNSSLVSPQETDTPATSDHPPAPVAGTHSELPDETLGGNGNSKAGAVNDDCSAAPVTLPDGWGAAYAAALKRAQKADSLPKYANQFWEQDGFTKPDKDSDDGRQAAAIFAAFKNNFGNKDAIEAELREVLA